MNWRSSRRCHAAATADGERHGRAGAPSAAGRSTEAERKPPPSPSRAEVQAEVQAEASRARAPGRGPAAPVFSEELGQPALTSLAELPDRRRPAPASRATRSTTKTTSTPSTKWTRTVPDLPRRRRGTAAAAAVAHARLGAPSRRVGGGPQPACARCTPSRAEPAWPARCAWVRWRTGWKPPSNTCWPRAEATRPMSRRCSARVDAITSAFELLRPPGRDDAGAGAAGAAQPIDLGAEEETTAAEAPDIEPGPTSRRSGPSRSRPKRVEPLACRRPAPIDWSRFNGGAGDADAGGRQAVASTAAVRVRAPLLDRLVNQAGEVSITRARIESDVGQIKGSLGDLNENLERLRRQLRDLELQAETQIASRMEAAKAASQEFDPLEMDRFTRFQELTRMMAESVNDVATVQRGLQRSAAGHRGRTGRSGPANARPAGGPAAHAHDRVRGHVRAPVPRRAPGRQGNRQAGPAGHRRRLDRNRPRRARPHDRRRSSICCATAWRTASSAGDARTAAGKDAPARSRRCSRKATMSRRVPRRRRRSGPGAHPRARHPWAAGRRPGRRSRAGQPDLHARLHHRRR